VATLCSGEPIGPHNAITNSPVCEDRIEDVASKPAFTEASLGGDCAGAPLLIANLKNGNGLLIEPSS
jgi:hypothetical protein